MGIKAWFGWLVGVCLWSIPYWLPVLLTIDCMPLCRCARDILAAITLCSLFEEFASRSPFPSCLYLQSCVEILSLRSALSPFTTTSLGKHMAVVKAQLPLTFSGWKENTKAVGRVGRELLLLSVSLCSYSGKPWTTPPPLLQLRLL